VRLVSSKHSNLTLGILLALAALAVYGRTFSAPFEFDDADAITNNPSIRHWSTVLEAPIDSTPAGRPILNLSLALNFAFGGARVTGYHAVNLAIHVLAGLVLFGILRRTLAPRCGAAADLAAFSAALAWTVHPLQTESVTYIVQRAESLMGLLYLLTLYSFIRGAEAGSSRVWFGMAWLACLLGMGTKEVMVSAPVMVLCYDRTFLAGSFRTAWRLRRRAYVGLAAGWLVLPFLVGSTHGRAGTSGFGSGIRWSDYVAAQFPTLVHYLRLAVWPCPQAFDYGTQWVTQLWTIAPAVGLVLGAAACAFWAFCRPTAGWRAVGYAGAWFFAILAPTSLVPGNRQTAAEHRMYLALIPLVALGVAEAYRWLGRAAFPLCLGLAAVYGGLAWKRNAAYSSALILWTDTLAHCPDNFYAHNNLGIELEKLPDRRPDAIAQYREALRLNPDFPEGHNSLGNALTAAGRATEAIAELTAAVRIAPRYAEAYSNLGNALARNGQWQEAIGRYEAALSLKPELSEAHDNLGNALAQQPGRIDEAIAQFHEALRLNPALAEAHNNLGHALENVPGRHAEAMAQYQAALLLTPDLAAAHNNLGNALNAEGRFPEAMGELETALRLNPAYPEAHNNLGTSLSKLPGRLDDAIAQFQAALRWKPDFAEANYNLGNAFNAAGRPQEAVAQYREAIRLNRNYAEARNNLANTLNGLGLLPAAIAQYREALRLQPDSAIVHLNLAIALLKLPSPATGEAAEHLQTVVRLQPTNRTAREILAQLR
jgi:tetratricopeptide (TPR) repeat protein